jgi:hypothetical protein
LSAALHPLLAELRAYGAAAYRVGDRVLVRRAKALPPELLARLRENKATLLTLVPDAPPPVDYEAIYATVTGTTGSIGDRDACVWWYELGHRDLPGELCALEHRCEELAREGAPEAEYRAAVEQLIARIREIRDAFEAERRRAGQR